MKPFYYFTLVFLIISFPLSAQVQNEAEISPTEMRDMLNAGRIPVHQAVNVEGSPYLFEDFYEGVVFLKNGRTTRSVHIRYNTHTQSIDFMSANQSFNVGLDNIESFSITIEGKQHTFTNGFDASGISEEDFLEIVVDGNATFAVRHNTNFMENTASYGTATQQDKYITSETFYIRVGEDDFNRIRRPNNRRILRNFPDFGDELDDFVDENDLDLSEKEDIAQLTAYYNTLSK